jgi:CHAD domain-containing protein
MAKARPIPGLGPDIAMREAAARTIEVRAQEVFEFAEGVFDTSDIERVHDMRVATRRLRAALEVFADCFPKQDLKRALRDVKRLADALGARRDPDVAIAALERIAADLTAADRPGVASFEDELRAEQAAGNRTLATVLAEVLESQLEERLLTLAAEARVPA